MLQVIRTSQAREDVLDIWQYIAVDSIEAADALVRRIDEVIRLLAEHPGLGAPQNRFRKGLRCKPVGRYLIFYDELPDILRIIRVLHGSRQWEDLIR